MNLNEEQLEFNFDPEISNTPTITQANTNQIYVSFALHNYPPSVMTLTAYVSNTNNTEAVSSQSISVFYTYETDSVTVSASNAVSSISSIASNSVITSALIFILFAYFPLLS